MVPLAVSSWSWHEDFYAGRLTLLDVPAAAASLGLDQVELNDFMLPSPRLGRVRRFFMARPAGPAHAWRYDDATLHRLKAELDRTGVGCLAWTVDSDLTVPGRYWPSQERYLHRAMDVARLLGAPVLRLTLGGDPAQDILADGRAANRLGKLVLESQTTLPRPDPGRGEPLGHHHRLPAAAGHFGSGQHDPPRALSATAWHLLRSRQRPPGGSGRGLAPFGLAGGPFPPQNPRLHPGW